MRFILGLIFEDIVMVVLSYKSTCKLCTKQCTSVLLLMLNISSTNLYATRSHFMTNSRHHVAMITDSRHHVAMITDSRHHVAMITDNWCCEYIRESFINTNCRQSHRMLTKLCSCFHIQSASMITVAKHVIGPLQWWPRLIMSTAHSNLAQMLKFIWKTEVISMIDDTVLHNRYWPATLCSLLVILTLYNRNPLEMSQDFTQKSQGSSLNL